MDSFEKNLKNAQVDLKLEPANFIPLIYKTEYEIKFIFKILEFLLPLVMIIISVFVLIKPVVGQLAFNDINLVEPKDIAVRFK